MELLIDHFRLLGVSPSADRSAVVRTLQVRLEHPPEDGFTQEALLQRSELLKTSSDLLSDTDKRKEYEVALLEGAAGLEISSSREIGGLILLWEAKCPHEAFKQSFKSLRPPQTPALGSGREADLTLLASLSCRSAAIQDQEDRRYESAATILQEGLRLLQRMGKLPDVRVQIEKELDSLLPYRILDLLSRDLGDEVSHQEGINLLDLYVTRRGGLEGQRSLGPNLDLDQTEFERFFQQIRSFLTVQEQIDLFNNWHKSGSRDSAFLGILSLVAAGFSRRKPVLLEKARRRLQRINLKGLDSMPLLACIDLLLADLVKVQERFRLSPDQGLADWIDTFPGDELAAYCEYCRNWLRKDVLPGYRDIDAKRVDLEAWFADRDVQTYIEQIERKSSSAIGFSLFTKSPIDEPKELEDNDINKTNDQNNSSNSELQENVVKDQLDDLEKNNNRLSVQDLIDIFFARLNNTRNNLSYAYYFKGKSIFKISTFVAFIVAVFIVSFFSMRYRTKDNTSTLNQVNLGINDSVSSKKDSIVENEEVVELTEKSINLLLDDEPNESQLKLLIESWLYSKSKILEGKRDTDLNKVASKKLVQIVLEARKKDSLLNQKQYVQTSIASLEIVSRTKGRIELKTRLIYKDQRMDEKGQIISETSIPNLLVTYILGRGDGVWRIYDFKTST